MSARLLHSSFGGKCVKCGKPYTEGQRIYWDRAAPRGRRGWHEDCNAPAAAPQAQQAQPAPIPEAAAGMDVERAYPGATIGQFDSAEELMQAALRPKHPDRATWKMWIDGHGGASWMGLDKENVTGLKEICALLSRGWVRGSDRIADAFASMPDIAAPISVRRRRVWTDQGDTLDIHAVYRGQLSTAWQRCTRRNGNGPRNIIITVDSLDSGGASADTMFWRGAATVALADKLTGAGYNVQVISSWTGNINSNEQLVCRVTCKPFTAPLDLPTLAATVACPAFFRSIGHAWGNGNSQKPNRGGGGFSVGNIEPLEGEITCRKVDVRDERTAQTWVAAQLARFNEPQQLAA